MLAQKESLRKLTTGSLVLEISCGTQARRGYGRDIAGSKGADFGMRSMNKESSSQLLDAYFDMGGNFIDTANFYTPQTASVETTLLRKMSTTLGTIPSRCMKDRVSTNAVDRVAGLAYLLRSQKLPPYYHATTEEEAWTMLVDTMDKTYRTQLLFLYPKPGNEPKQSWRLSWWQAMTENHPSIMDRIQLYDSDKFDRDGMVDIYNGYCIEQGQVEGLDATDSEGRLPNGKLTVKDIRGKEYMFDIAVTHQVPIAAGFYMLIGSEPWSQKSAKPRDENSKQYWVVGKPRKSGQEFEKVSVFQIADPGFMSRLDELGIAQRSRNILV
ncbi:uncharacterized protein ARMOST_12269 [Armillaria ostoyae]|uniref:NADP-dependent oxidoreductase domain-containing protein n=1 Tax=Armillaria ostoyae TaxID=47428 RepID=A0A284RJF3_ARMOS|nr:uncharacterized protein ARMOST_12269 [Armillaria ostoyae]